jgi:hypothetical protein
VVGGEPGVEDTVVGEPRWHMASAVVAAIVLILLMPDDLRLGPRWLLPLIEGGLLVALILGDPGKIDRIVDFAFPQQMNPNLAPPRWRPGFVDYLYLGFTNATAFSPTDAMPLAPWAKIAMAVQATISLVILGLVIARAVNIFA